MDPRGAHSGLATPCRGSVGGIRAAPSVCRCDIATSIARTNNSLRRHALGRSSIVFEIETVAAEPDKKFWSMRTLMDTGAWQVGARCGWHSAGCRYAWVLVLDPHLSR